MSDDEALTHPGTGLYSTGQTCAGGANLTETAARSRSRRTTGARLNRFEPCTNDHRSGIRHGVRGSSSSRYAVPLARSDSTATVIEPSDNAVARRSATHTAMIEESHRHLAYTISIPSERSAASRPVAWTTSCLDARPPTHRSCTTMSEVPPSARLTTGYTGFGRHRGPAATSGTARSAVTTNHWKRLAPPTLKIAVPTPPCEMSWWAQLALRRISPRSLKVLRKDALRRGRGSRGRPA